MSDDLIEKLDKIIEKEMLKLTKDELQERLEKNTKRRNHNFFDLCYSPMQKRITLREIVIITKLLNDKIPLGIKKSDGEG